MLTLPKPNQNNIADKKKYNFLLQLAIIYKPHQAIEVARRIRSKLPLRKDR